MNRSFYVLFIYYINWLWYVIFTLLFINSRYRNTFNTLIQNILEKPVEKSIFVKIRLKKSIIWIRKRQTYLNISSINISMACHCK